MVSFSAAESETYAIKASKVDRLETLDHRRKLSERSKLSQRCQTHKEAKCTRKTKEKLFGARRSNRRHRRPRLLTRVGNLQKRRLHPREPPDKISLGLDTFENAKESPSNLDTRVLEREAMPSRVSKYRVVAVTGRFAAPWSTRAQWSCFGFCGLARTTSTSDEVIVNGHWSKRVNGTTTGVMEATDSICTFAVNVGAGGAVAKAMLVWP